MIRTILSFLFLFTVLTWAEESAVTKPESKVPAQAQTQSAGASTPENAAALRNENVFASKLDTETLKADNIRLGASYTLVTEAAVEANYFAVEHGRSASEQAVLGKPKFGAGWHGELFDSLQNSVFNARTFFQVGPVMPSRSNDYGARFTGNVASLGFLTGSFSQRKVRGMVNGNAQIPLLSEHTPLTTDPVLRPIVQRILDAYPSVAPNLPLIDERALNTNAPQSINEIGGDLRLDKRLSDRKALSLSYSLSRQNIDAFQLVAGLNPDTIVHSHKARVTYSWTLSDATDISLGAGFTRSRADLHPEPNAFGPKIRNGNAFEDLGPDDQYPINRAENRYRYGMVGAHRTAGSRHSITFGGDITRYQMNGAETNKGRGSFAFGNAFGRNSIENLLMGTPTLYEVALGDTNRGFRNWSTNLFAADQWRVNSRLQIYYGVRHGIETRPVEVNHMSELPYATDWNNFSPRLSLAIRGPMDWVVRAGYSVSFGQILPVTVSQTRFNYPGMTVLQVQNPYLPDPLRGINLGASNVRYSPTVFSPDMVAPYSHQYSASFERRFGNLAQVRFGYVGSRSFKMLNSYVQNRAQLVPGIPTTTATVDQRRPDQRYYDIKRILNGGIAYLDAAQIALVLPNRRGLTSGVTYTFGKALDQGSSYTSTAANKDLNHKAQTQYESFADKKSLSDFDSTHALILFALYDLPKTRGSKGMLKRIAGNWQLSGTFMAKTGTPWYVQTGSDAPGYGNVDGASGDRPNILNPSILGATISHPDTSTQILRREYFSYITPEQQRGSLPWNAFRKQAIRNMNAALAREWAWGAQRTYRVRFRAEAFNAGNHAQFDKAQENLTSPSFGKITNTLNDGRVFQFALRLSL